MIDRLAIALTVIFLLLGFLYLDDRLNPTEVTLTTNSASLEKDYYDGLGTPQGTAYLVPDNFTLTSIIAKLRDDPALATTSVGTVTLGRSSIAITGPTLTTPTTDAGTLFKIELNGDDPPQTIPLTIPMASTYLWAHTTGAATINITAIIR